MADEAIPLPSYNQTAHTSVVRKIGTQQIGILTRISVVRIINRRTGKNAFFYAQHDPGSQVTLISETFLKELDLVPVGKSQITLHTISSSETSELENVVFDIKSLHNDKNFFGLQALVVLLWSDKGCLCLIVRICRNIHSLMMLLYAYFLSAQVLTF